MSSHSAHVHVLPLILVNGVAQAQVLISHTGCLFVANIFAKGVREFVSDLPDRVAWYHHPVPSSQTSVLPDGELAVCIVPILSIVSPLVLAVIHSRHITN